MTNRDPATIYGEMEPLEKAMNTPKPLADETAEVTPEQWEWLLKQSPTHSRRAEMLDYFAAHALQGLLANGRPVASEARAFLEDVCDRCYQYPDQMLREREKWVK